MSAEEELRAVDGSLRDISDSLPSALFYDHLIDTIQGIGENIERAIDRHALAIVLSAGGDLAVGNRLALSGLRRELEARLEPEDS